MLLISRPVTGPQDEECVTTFLWIMERALHNEAFLTQVNLLKELKFKVSKIKLQFVNKGHFSKSMSGTGLNKTRWVSNGGKKSSQSPSSSSGTGSSSVDCAKRKNSSSSQVANYNTMVQHLQQYQHQILKSGSSERVQSSSSHSPSSKIGPTGQAYNKSSSYPNFSQHLKISNHTHSSHQAPAVSVGVLQPHQGQPNPILFAPQQQQQIQPQALQSQQHLVLNGNYHRHSLNNLMGGNAAVLASLGQMTTTTINPTNAALLPNNRLDLCLVNNPGNILSKENSEVKVAGGEKQTMPTSTLQAVSANRHENNENIDIGNQCADKNTIGDINSRLEFLCLQMTEQAIN